MIVSIKLLLQPRKFIWKSRQKHRGSIGYTDSRLTYGSCGLRLLSPYRTSAKRIFRFKIFLKRATKKPDITRRSLWINLFPHLPLTKKTKGMRMGKGAGKLSSWFTQLRGGVFIVEFRNLRRGRAIYFSKQIQHKLPVETRFVERGCTNFKLYSGRRANPSYSTLS